MNKKDLINNLDEMKNIKGYPDAKDADILKLSEEPYYTACPNPYISQFINKYGTRYNVDSDSYEKKPFIADVSEGKTDSIYLAHSYHTKVPHKAIINFIEHFTKEGDIVYDGFCGSGMTGIAAQLLNRHPILSDISPNATFLANNYNKYIDAQLFEKDIQKILKDVREELSWLYETNHTSEHLCDSNKYKTKNLFNEEKKGIINYTIWSDVFNCPYCSKEFVFWDAAVDKNQQKINKNYNCPNCDAELTKNNSERVMEKKYDNILNKEIIVAKQKPVLINYSIGNKRYEKKPDKDDLALIEYINNSEIPYWIPNEKLPKGYNTSQPLKSHGISHVHLFYTKRNLWVISSFYAKSNSSISKQIVHSVLGRASMMYRWNGSRPTGTLTGTLYVGSLKYEFQIFDMLERKFKAVLRSLFKKDEKNKYIISTQSTADLSNIPEDSIDYIFTDPPFGDNIMYSELNYIQEAWLKIFTNNKTEAIVNDVQNKSLNEYTVLMTNAFQEMYRILKPNRWLTVEFHNSRASVWNAIQESITRAGFIIAQVSTLDKKQGTFKQITTSGAVKNDLIINAYKPKKEFEEKFLKNAGEGMEIDFVQQQLEHLPIGANIERTEKMLYSKMLAHYVENGFKIKYNANNFYTLLHDNFIERDGYWFLEDQADEYTNWKSSLKLDELEDIKKGSQVLFVVDEKTALIWIYNFIDEPKDYGEIYTNYEQVATRTDDEIPELREMLDNNFVREDGKYRRPQSKQERAKIEKNRQAELNRAWKDLLDRAKNGKRKIKNVRKEALVHGFTKCYQEENYQDIITVADRLYASTLESSGEILDFVDIARMKLAD